MDILLFAILTGFLFFRLWNVLGSRTGSEKPRFDVFDPQPEMAREDNVLLLPGKKIEPVVSDTHVQDLNQKINTLKDAEPQFNENAFINGAMVIFPRIILSFARGDLVDLKKFLTKDVYKSFEKAVKERVENKQERMAEVENVRAEIKNIEIDTKKMVRIDVRFLSHQMLATVDADGNSYDNPARLNVPMIDIWTFVRKIGDANPTWLLASTKTEIA